MPQSFKQLDLNIREGAPASAIPRSWFLFVNNVLKYLRVSNGRILTYGDKWTIEFQQNDLPYAFGIRSFDSTENKLVIGQGIIKKGSMTRIVEEAEIPVTGDPAFVILKVNKNTADGEWISTSVSTVPADTQTETYLPFYEYENSAPQGSPVKMKLSRIHRIGSVFL